MWDIKYITRETKKRLITSSNYITSVKTTLRDNNNDETNIYKETNVMVVNSQDNT